MTDKTNIEIPEEFLAYEENGNKLAKCFVFLEKYVTQIIMKQIENSAKTKWVFIDIILCLHLTWIWIKINKIRFINQSIPIIFISLSMAISLVSFLWSSRSLIVQVVSGLIDLLKWIVKVIFIFVDVLIYFWPFKNILFVLSLSVNFQEVILYQMGWKQIDKSITFFAWVNYLSKSCPKIFLPWVNIILNQHIINDETFLKILFAVRSSTSNSHCCKVDPVQIGSKPFVKKEAFKGLFSSRERFKFD